MMVLNQNLAHIKKELTVPFVNILKCKYCVNQSHDVSRDHFAKNRNTLFDCK